VAAVRGGRAWVSGSQGALSSPIFYHWTGASWVRLPRPGIGGDNVFAGGISASTDPDVWGLLANAAAAAHWNGRCRRRFTFGTRQTTAIGGLVALRPGLAWVFSHDFNASTDTAWRFNGSVFSSRSLPADVNGAGFAGLVSASSPANVWAWALTEVTDKWV